MCCSWAHRREYSGIGSEVAASRLEWRYGRHHLEQTPLDRLVAEHSPRLTGLLASQDRSLPDQVQREFEDFPTCGQPQHDFLRIHCQGCHSERLARLSVASDAALAPAAAPDGWSKALRRDNQ